MIKLSLLAATALSLCTLPAKGADIEAGKAKAQVCFACHGVNGNSTNSMFPVLAGQNARYIYLELRDYKEGARSNPMMSPMAAALSKTDMQDIAAFFESRKPVSIPFKADPARVKLGFAKSEEVLCTMCHLGGLKGQNEIPRLTYQHYDYTLKQLTDFKAHTRTNDAGNMSAVSKTLTDDDIVNISHYISSLE